MSSASLPAHYSLQSVVCVLVVLERAAFAETRNKAFTSPSARDHEIRVKEKVLGGGAGGGGGGGL